MSSVKIIARLMSLWCYHIWIIIAIIVIDIDFIAKNSFSRSATKCLVDCAKEMNADVNSSVNNAITRMINPGDRINIPCSVVSPGGSVQWVQNGKPILLDFSVTQRRHWNISNDGMAALTINRVTKADEGVWECWELNSQGDVKQKSLVMKLVVTNVPEAPFIEVGGQRLSHSDAITVREKSDITVNCVVRGASPPVRHVNWYIEDRNVTQASKLLMEYSAEEDISIAISLLVVNATRQLHQKLVICQVFHVSWLNPATVSASLNVLYVPSFSISREPGFGFPIIEGMSVSLKCEIDANPLSDAKWHKDTATADDASHSPVNANSSLPQLITSPDGCLNFSLITKNDTGWYRCATQHQFGYFASFGYYLNVRLASELLPEFQHILQSPLLRPKIDDQSETLKEGKPNEAALMKSFDASKQSFESSISSSSRDAMSVTAAAHHHKHHTRNNIHHHQQQHHKECHDDNDSNNNGKPVIESINRTVVVLVGRTISLSAKFCCNPRPNKVYWIHRHLAIMPSRVIGPYITRELIIASSNSLYCYTSSFEIQAVKPEDSGDVLFIVINSKGSDYSTVTVNVTIAGFSVSKGSTSHYNSQIAYFLAFALTTALSFVCAVPAMMMM